MITTTSPTSVPTNVEHEDLLILHVLPSDLHATREEAAALGTDFVGVLQQPGLGTPTYFAGSYVDGAPCNRVALTYSLGGEKFERIWNCSRIMGDGVTYTLRSDDSSHGYVSDATN